MYISADSFNLQGTTKLHSRRRRPGFRCSVECPGLGDVFGEAAGEAGAVRLHVELGHGAVLHHHGEPLAPGVIC